MGYTRIGINEYNIAEELNTSQITIKLACISDDHTPDKYTKFLKDLEEFLKDKGYSFKR